jgi:1-acyl-sn-glycerol-3-phosphate acyltransferase
MTEERRYPIPPAALRHDRGCVLKWLGRTWLRLTGWQVEGAFPEETRGVIIVAPHTSNWDFILGIAVVFALELRISWLGKHSLFKPPFRAFLGWLGGIPVDRRSSHGVVADCVKAFASTPALLLALAPEGTRKGVSPWKTGFYRIACEADVPIFPVSFDYRDHAVHLMPPFHPTGNIGGDLTLIQNLFIGVEGHHLRSN